MTKSINFKKIALLSLVGLGLLLVMMFTMAQEVSAVDGMKTKYWVWQEGARWQMQDSEPTEKPSTAPHLSYIKIDYDCRYGHLNASFTGYTTEGDQTNAQNRWGYPETAQASDRFVSVGNQFTISIPEGMTDCPAFDISDTVTPFNLNGTDVNFSDSIIPTEKTYDGIAPNAATVVVKNGDNYVIPAADYVVKYEKNNVKYDEPQIEAGTYDVVIYPSITGNCASGDSGQKVGQFTILQKDLDTVTITVIDDVIYNGITHTPEPTVSFLNGQGTITLTEGTDFTYSYSDNLNAGTATVTITAVDGGNYTRTKSVQFTILQKNLDTVTIASVDDVIYDGTEHTPEPTVSFSNGQDTITLTEGTDFTYSYSNNLNAGTATVTIAAVDGGNYTRTKSANFTIVQKDLVTVDIAAVNNITYDGTAHTPTPVVSFSNGQGTITLTEGTDFTYSYSDNLNAGVATATITAVDGGNYTGTNFVQFTIDPKPFELTGYDITGIQGSYIRTGSEIRPVPKVTDKVLGELVLNRDYTLVYKNNVTLGTAQVIITGIGNYTGEVTVNFQITLSYLDYMIPVIVGNQTTSAKPEITVDEPVIYDGQKQTPDVTVKVGGKTLKEGTDYELTYKNNTNAGTATVEVDFKGNYSNIKDQTVEFTIEKAQLMVTFLDETIELGEKAALAFTVTGFVNGETAKTAKGYTAPSVELNVPERTGKFILFAEGGKADNYTFKYIEGYVTVINPEHRNCAVTNFTDLNADADYHEAVDFVVGNGYFKGISATEFNPFGTMNRAMIVTVLGRIAGIRDTGAVDCGFSDVNAEQFSWAMSFIKWGKETGIVKGISDTEFAPKQNVTIEQAVTFLYRFAQVMGADVNVRGNYDISGSDISEYAVDATTWAFANNIIGESELDNAKSDASRILFAEMIYAISEMIE